MTLDLDAALSVTVTEPESAVTLVRSDRRHRHVWVPMGRAVAGDLVEVWEECDICHRAKDVARSRRGKQSRNYGNRAELDVARRYGGTKVGHAGGPVDVRGRDFATQVKTHRRRPPAEWTTAFAKLEATTDRIPRLLLRFVQVGQPPIDYVVLPAKAWLDWFGKDDEEAPR